MAEQSGYCSYSMGTVGPVSLFEHKGETWYIADLPYIWEGGTQIPEIYYGKELRNINDTGTVVRYMIDDYLGTE